VTVEIECQGRSHRLRWERGKLVLEDHDVSAERAMVALGGPSFTCLDLLNVWEDGARDLHAVHRLRGLADTPLRPVRSHQLHVPASQLPGPPPRLLSQLPERQRQALQVTLDLRERARLLWSLPPELHVRVGLSAVMRAERGDEGARERDAAHLDETLRILAMPAIRAAMAAAPTALDAQRVDIDCWSVGPDHAPWIDGKVDRSAASAGVGLPWSWLTKVWAWNLAVVGANMVLAVTDADLKARTVRALVARWEQGPPGSSSPVLRNVLLARDGSGEWRTVGPA